MYSRQTDTALRQILANLHSVCEQYRTRKSSGEVFDSPAHYEDFNNGWRDCQRKLKAAAAEYAKRGL